MPSLRKSSLRLTLACVALAVLAGSAGVAAAQSDADLLAAKDAYDRGDKGRLDTLAPALKGHVLEPYVEFWQLRTRLDDVDYDAVRGFLGRYPNTPLADRLRVEWLKALARRGDWTTFALEYPPPAGEDVELTCYGVQLRRFREGDAALAAAKPLWFSSQSTPDACEPLFVELVARGELGTADLRERFRLASEAGAVRLAQAIGSAMPGAAHIDTRTLVQIERDPQHALARGEFAWKTPAGRDLALYALERASRKSAETARPAWLKIRDRLSQDDRRYGNLRLAYHAARQLTPAANDWFREASGAPMSSEVAAWRVRAALRIEAWPDVRAAIAALPSPDQQEASWRYWKARAQLARGEAEDARKGFEALSDDVGFYGLLAAEASGRGAEKLAAIASDAKEPDIAALSAFGARADVRRAIKLAQLDMRPESIREWAYIARGQDDDTLLLAAEFARRAGLYDRAINIAERTVTRHDYGLRYMTPFRDEFAAAARDQGLPEEILYGIARQESRFVPDIVSSAGAVGLMQLMPGTARWVAKQMARTDYTPEKIANVDLNTQFGAFYFRYWNDRLDKLPALTAAAYNAGPARAQAWRPVAQPLEGAIWVETIPFTETRDYVKKVLANTMLYSRALGRPYVPLSTLLGVVAPRGSLPASLAQSP
jgi:soluble lytic murein transglycosylase